jgi:ectoine hydrolase
VQNQMLFSQSEYDRRIRRTREMMDHRGMEVLLVVDPANMNYLTGYDGWSFYVHQGVILSLDADTPIWFGRQQDANGARLTTWLPGDCIYGYPDEYVQSRYTHTMRYVAQLLRDRGLAEKRLGLEMDGYWFSARMYLTLQEELTRSTLMDATNLVNWVKTVKSDAEITYMRQAARICEKVMQTAIDGIAPGVLEREVAATVTAAQIAGTDEFGGAPPAIFPIMPSAVNA